MFKEGELYSKKNIYQLLDVPIELQRGSWDTGYHTYKNDVFIFANIGIAGRTGHDYNNHWENEELVWFGKTGSHINQISIQNLLKPRGKIYIFTRVDSASPFTFSGEGVAIRYVDTRPVCIVWGLVFKDSYYPDEIKHTSSLKEGGLNSIFVNQYERNPTARQFCIDHYGAMCQICEFDFEKTYGSIGIKFIHVHHIVQLSSIAVEYVVDPICDLIPVCPNCHAMIHRRSPPYSVSDLRYILESNKSK